MALTIPAYKSNTVSSIAGVTFVSNGTPFVAGDVGRCIVITSGSAIGQIRKIVGYTSTTTVTVDYAWNISPYRNFINAVSGVAFVEVLPVSTNGWTMSSYLDDVDDTTNILKALGTDVYSFVGTNVITITGFLYETRKTIYLNTSYVALSPTGYARFGDINENGTVFNGCCLNDLSNDWTPNRSWTNTVNGDAGNLHLYDCLVSITQPTGAGDGMFWSLYNASTSQYRFDGCSFNGNFGIRFRGDRSLMKNCQWFGGDSQLAVPTPIDWETIGPYGTVGLITGVKFLNKDTVIYWNKAYFGWQIENISFENISNTLVYVTGTDTGPGTIIGFNATEVESLPVVIEVSTATAGSLFLKNPITSSVVDQTLSTITDSYKRVIWNSTNTTVDTEIVTDGDWNRYDALWWTYVMSGIGDVVLANGTTTTPFVQAIISYLYFPNKLIETLRLPSVVQFTGIIDGNITQTGKTTVDAYSLISDGERLYDRSKSWTFDNFEDQFPSQGSLLINANGTLLDLGSVNLIINGGAASAFAVSQTGNGTITIDAGTKLTPTTGGFNSIKTTGTITIQDATNVDNWTFNGNVVLNANLNLTGVTITGDLNINIAANTELTFTNITVGGNVYNDATGNTLKINANAVSSITAGDPGEGNGQTNVVVTVPLKITVKDIVSSSVIEGARVFIKAASGGNLPSKASVTITRATTVATVTHTAHGMISGEFIIIEGANEIDYNGAYLITVTGVNSYTYTVSGTPATPATGTITATSRLVNDLTDGAGEVNKTHRYTGLQPVEGVVRKATLI